MGRPELTAIVRCGDKAQAGLRGWVHTDTLAGLTLHPHCTHAPSHAQQPPPAQVYYVYGFFLLVFLILIIVTICVTIVASYFLLNAENYHWHWTSFGAGASTCARGVGWWPSFFRSGGREEGAAWAFVMEL